MTVDTPPVRADGLQLDEMRDFQERFWTIERIAWIGFVSLLLAALAGFTGAGGVLSQRAANVAGARFEYPLVMRRQNAETFKLSFRDAGTQSIAFSPAFSEAFQLERVQPQPQQERSGPDGLTLQFQADAGGAAHLHVKPRHPALVSFELKAGGESRTLGMLILP